MAAPLSNSCSRSDDIGLPPSVLVVLVVVVSALQLTVPTVVTPHAAFPGTAKPDNAAPITAISNACRRLGAPRTPVLRTAPTPSLAPAGDHAETFAMRRLGAIASFLPRGRLPAATQRSN